MGDELWQKSAIDVAAGIPEREFSCSEVMASVVEPIRALNPRLNAIVTDLSDQALAEAAAADRALQQFAEPGPLFGVPVTIKVNVDVEGQANTNALPASATLIAPGDSPIVRNLRRAGAIVVGRTNTPEVSMRLTTLRHRWNARDRLDCAPHLVFAPPTKSSS
jgi:amidase